MNIDRYTFGSIRIDGEDYDHDVIVDRGKISKRKKKASKEFRGQFGHTPLSLNESLPWSCKTLIVGTGAHGALPVMDDVKKEASRRGVELRIMSTPEAVALLKRAPAKKTNAVIHVTC